MRSTKNAVRISQVGVKLSTEDWEPEGIRIEETIEVAKALEREGVSHLNMMGGTQCHRSPGIPAAQCLQRQFIPV